MVHLMFTHFKVEKMQLHLLLLFWLTKIMFHLHNLYSHATIVNAGLLVEAWFYYSKVLFFVIPVFGKLYPLGLHMHQPPH